MSSNPIFGLNSLGGSLVLTTKKGVDFIGNNQLPEISFEGGSFGYNTQSFEFGAGWENSGLYISTELQYEEGWRDYSPGDIKRTFINYGAEFEKLDYEISILGAETEVNGNGVTPVELLEKERESVFTWPDTTSNQLVLLGSSGSYYFNDDSILSASFYFRNLRRQTLNADEVDAEECEDDTPADISEINSDIGFVPLCGEENSNATGYGIILDQYGNAIEADDNIRSYGLLNKTFTKTNTWGAALQYDLSRELFENTHNFIIGMSSDKSRTEFRSRGELGKLLNNRTVTNVVNNTGGTIELAAEAEHEGSGEDLEAAERGDVGPAELVSEVDYYGLYATDTFDITDKNDMTISARANLALVELHDRLTPVYSRTETVNGDHRYFRINPAIGFTHKYDNSTNFYASYRESNRAPAPVELSCASPTAPCRLPNAFVADPPLEQVVTKSYELGVRGKLKSNNYTGIWSGLVHTNLNKNDILFVSSGTGLSSGYFQNFGKTRRRGLDMQLGLQIPNKLGKIDFFSNYSYLEATYQTSHTLPAANHPNGANDIEIGDTIPGMPKNTFKAGISQSFNNKITIGLNALGSSGVYKRGDESNQLKKTSHYAVFNASASYSPFPEFEFVAKINNLLNSDYETMGVLGEASSSEVSVPISELGDTGSGDTKVGPLDPNFLSPGAPINFTLGIRFRW